MIWLCRRDARDRPEEERDVQHSQWMYDSSTSPKPVIGLRDGLAQGQGVLQGGLLNNVVPVGESRAKTKEALTLIAKNHHKNHQGQVKGIKHILPIGNRRPARQVADL